MGKMKDARKRVAAAENAIAAAMRGLNEARDELRVARGEYRKLTQPKEPGGHNAVIVFSLWLRQSVGTTKRYDYAAIKAGSRWFTTGSTCPPSGYSWDGLVTFIRSAVVHSRPVVLDGREPEWPEGVWDHDREARDS